MFAYDKLPIEDVSSGHDIEALGYQSLLRALNIGRVVAFSGSGANYIFGQPSWPNIKNYAVAQCLALDLSIKKDIEGYFDKKLGERRPARNMQSPIRQDYERTLKSLAEEIELLRLYKEARTPEFVALCENYFQKAEHYLKTHNSVGETLDYAYTNCREEIVTQVNIDPKFFEKIEQPARNLEEFRKRIASVFCSTEVCNNSSYLKWGDAHSNTIEMQAKKLSKKLKRKCDKRALKTNKLASADKEIYELDSHRALYRKLGIRRYITLNYDLEIERMLYEETRAAPIEQSSILQNFMNTSTVNGFGLNVLPGGDIKVESGSGRTIRSSSSRSSSLSSLFAFGAFPTNFDSTVHHIHGRIDDNKNMVVTPRDYQRVYYGNSEQQRSFEEARHAVFTGSDIFLYGLGDSEHDVLKPFRDFLELEPERADSYGKVYYLTSLDLGKFQFANDVNVGLEKYFELARQQCLTKVQYLYQTYGFYTLFDNFLLDDFHDWSESNQTAFADAIEIAYYKKSLESKKTDWSEFNRTISGATISKESNEIKLARSVFKIFKAKDKDSKYSEIRKDDEARKDALNLVNALVYRLRSKSLVRKISHLREDRISWWEKWSAWPGIRWAVYGPNNYESCYNANEKLDVKLDTARESYSPEEPLVWKHTTLVTNFGPGKISLGKHSRTAQLTDFIEVTNKAANTKSQSNHEAGIIKSAVARISIPRGMGKGRLLSFLTNRQTLDPQSIPMDWRHRANTYFKENGKPIQKNEKLYTYPYNFLFQRDSENHSDSIEYIGCYSAHLTLSLEFSSQIFGLVRFLQHLMRSFLSSSRLDSATERELTKLINTPLHEKDEDREMGLELLSSIFKFLCEHHPWKKYGKGNWPVRAVVIFSYLDRLVDANGDGYSPIHRRFFRMINNHHDPEFHALLPIDFVFINCQATKPIRYLSIEKPLKYVGDRLAVSPTRKPYDNWHVRNKLGVRLKYWEEISSITPNTVLKEALYNTISIDLASKGENSEKVLDTYNEILAVLTDSKSNFLLPDCPKSLKDFSSKRVLYCYCMMALVYAIWLKCENDENKFKWNLQNYFNDLSKGLLTSKTLGFFSELIKIYRDIDRTFDTQHNSGCPKRNLENSASRIREQLASVVLNHLSLFNYTLPANVLMVCPEISELILKLDTFTEKNGKSEFKKILIELVQRGFVSHYVKYRCIRKNVNVGRLSENTIENFVFCLDTKISAAIRSEMRLATFSGIEDVPFQGSLFPSQSTTQVNPEVSHYQMVRRIISELVDETHRQLIQMKIEIADIEAGKLSGVVDTLEDISDKLRSAYALIRGTFSISVISRLNGEDDTFDVSQPFDVYRGWIRKLLNTSILIFKIEMVIREQFRTAKKLKQAKVDCGVLIQQPFFRDELAWLYNERALVGFIQGRLFDALPLYEQAEKISNGSHRSSEPVSYRANIRRVKLNRGLVQLERGHLQAAMETFESIFDQTVSKGMGYTPSIVHTYARGYIALCLHLGDKFKQAESSYIKTIEELREFGEQRGLSIFLRHRADLLRAKSKSERDERYLEAIDSLTESEQIAQSIRAIDLQNYSHIARARLHRDMSKRPEALEQLRSAEKYANSMGNQKMLTEIYKVRGEILLAEGEATQAGFVSAQSVAMAKRNGMRLRKISAIIIQSRIMIMRNQKSDAEYLLKEALSESLAFGYAMKSSLIAKELSKLR